MRRRQQNIARLAATEFDALVVGGGINGAVSAAALSHSGAVVGLIDARDFAGFTSQHSSNLIWGGIKYMEGYEFMLVNSLCKSRNELLRAFPSTVKEIRFLTAVPKNFRHRPCMMLAGAWLYWLLGRGMTRPPRLLSADKIKAAEPLINTDNSRGGIEYSDAYLHDNDARFVFNFVLDAMRRGCIAANYVESLGARREGGLWVCNARDTTSGETFTIRAKALINAAGAFVDAHNDLCGVATEHRHVFSKGIHLIVPRLAREHRVLAFFADDSRLFFVIPMANRACIGTTDTPVQSPLSAVTDADREFVLSNINARLDLAQPLRPADIIAERCGVRPLAVKRGAQTKGDFLQLSRRHVIETEAAQRHISIFGGKLTDCLNIGREVRAALAGFGVKLAPLPAQWFGEADAATRAAYFKFAQRLGLGHMPAGDTGEMLSERLWRRYGEHAMPMLELIAREPSMAQTLIEGSGVRRCELDHLAENEMIVRLEDYLRRRSKLELLISRERLKSRRGLSEVCARLFGAQAQDKHDEYFNGDAP